MSDYVKRKFTIREHSGGHRLFSEYGCPPCPPGIQLTTTLEAVHVSSTGGIAADPSCVYRRDNDLWHQPHVATLPLGSCMKVVTFVTGEEVTYPLTVRDKGAADSWEKYYLVGLRFRPGFNHLVWCKDMDIGCYTGIAADMAVFGTPVEKEHYRWAFSIHAGPSIFFHHEQGEILQTYKYSGPGRYKRVVDNHHMAYTPRFMASGGTSTHTDAVYYIPPLLQLYSTSKDKVPQWATHIMELETSNEPTSFDPRSRQAHNYIHLRYIPKTRKGNTYIYSQWGGARHAFNLAEAVRESVSQGNVMPLWKYCPFPLVHNQGEE
jgi:uncharacterized protein YndB with AHSA1/START domain